MILEIDPGSDVGVRLPYPREVVAVVDQIVVFGGIAGKIIQRRSIAVRVIDVFQIGIDQAKHEKDGRGEKVSTVGPL